MAEAHTEDGKFTGKPLDEFHGDSSFLRRARTGRNHDAFRLSPGNFIHSNFVVAVHFDLATQLAEILREVVGEGIVVVEKQNHNRLGYRLSKPKRDFSGRKKTRPSK